MTTIWRWRARFYNICEGSDLRRGRHKAELFRGMDGKVLFMAVGTGIDIKHFPTGVNITAIDISAEMLRRALGWQRAYQGTLRLVRADALNLPFPDAVFDTAVTSCTMCSVPDPVRALCEIRRVLRPGGRLLMFEHVRSRNVLLGLALDMMTLWTRFFGTEMNRDTLANIRLAGFEIRRIESIFLDIILSIQAVKTPARQDGCGTVQTGLVEMESAGTQPRTRRCTIDAGAYAVRPTGVLLRSSGTRIDRRSTVVSRRRDGPVGVPSRVPAFSVWLWAYCGRRAPLDVWPHGWLRAASAPVQQYGRSAGVEVHAVFALGSI